MPGPCNLQLTCAPSQLLLSSLFQLQWQLGSWGALFLPQLLLGVGQPWHFMLQPVPQRNLQTTEIEAGYYVTQGCPPIYLAIYGVAGWVGPTCEQGV